MVTHSRPKADTPVLELAHGYLQIPGGGHIALESDDWYRWLEDAIRFYVVHPAGNFSCRKDGRARGGTYWSAFRRSQGVVERVYLGKSESLTMGRLREVGNDLSAALQTTRDQTTQTQHAQRNTIASDIVVTDVTTDETYLWLTLTDGRIIGAPLAWFPRLADATLEERAKFIVRGAGIHWPAIDEDISARVLLGHPS